MYVCMYVCMYVSVHQSVHQRSTEGGGVEHGTSSNLRENPAHKSAENRDLRGFSIIFQYFAPILDVFAQILHKCSDICATTCEICATTREMCAKTCGSCVTTCKICATYWNMRENPRRSQLLADLYVGFSRRFEDVPFSMQEPYVRHRKLSGIVQ